MSHQDIDVISEAVKYNKGVVFAVNKWDLVEKETNTAKNIQDEIYARVKMFDYVPVIFISALTKQRIFKALDIWILPMTMPAVWIAAREASMSSYMTA